MLISLGSQVYPLTYCMNVHPIQNLEDLYHTLEVHTLEVKKKVANHEKMGLGLWFSEDVAYELQDKDQRSRFKNFLQEKELFAFTFNGFPQNFFHASSVKEKVYLPTWGDRDRLGYSCNLADILSDLLPDFVEYGSISTLPLHFKENTSVDWGNEIGNLLRMAIHLHRMKEKVGKEIVLCLEPEPLCALETTEEAIAFFKNHLFSKAGQMAFLYGLSEEKAEEILRTHLALCWDTCHQAVEFEDASESLESIRKAGVRIGKVQLSNAIEFSPSHHKLEVLKDFTEERYLHQVVGKDRKGNLHRARDLSDIWKEEEKWKEMERMRIHFHIPLFCETLPQINTTLEEMKKTVAYFLKNKISTHFEVETYTWNVLPQWSQWSAENLSQALAEEWKVILKTFQEALI